jgi:Major Facilitator Superfamily
MGPERCANAAVHTFGRAPNVNDAPEGDDMTTSDGSASAQFQELAAAVRSDLIMPGDPGHDDALPQAGQPETGRRRWAVLAVVSAAQFLIILDLWVVNIALPALQHDFAPATLSDVSWILDIYAIVLAVLLLPAGRAADSIGRRARFLAGLVVFGIASLGCAVAPDLSALIACRALQAVGAAVLLPVASLGGEPGRCSRCLLSDRSHEKTAGPETPVYMATNAAARLPRHRRLPSPAARAAAAGRWHRLVRAEKVGRPWVGGRIGGFGVFPLEDLGRRSRLMNDVTHHR